MWGRPVEMELKSSKISYQKSRLPIILFFVIINLNFEMLMAILFGASEFHLTNKHEQSIGILLVLVMIIVFR